MGAMLGCISDGFGILRVRGRREFERCELDLDLGGWMYTNLGVPLYVVRFCVCTQNKVYVHFSHEKGQEDTHAYLPLNCVYVHKLRCN